LMLIDSKDRSTVILSSALGVFGAMSLLLGLLWKKHLSVHSQLDTFKEEMQMKEVESDKLAMQCNYLEEKYQSLQQHIYENNWEIYADESLLWKKPNRHGWASSTK
jgi:hypothetical protein